MEKGLEERIDFNGVNKEEVESKDLDLIAYALCFVDRDISGKKQIKIDRSKTTVRFYKIENEIKVHMEIYSNDQEKEDKHFTIEEARKYIRNYFKKLE